MTLREPPKKPQASRIAGRFLGLIILLGLFALVVWTAATNQQAAAIQRSNPNIHAPGEHHGVPGGIIHARSFGSSDGTTVLVHDDTVAGGAALTQLAASLADRGKLVVVPDLIGFGFSSRPSEPDRRLATSGQADTLATFLDDRGHSSVDLVGFGWGGEVAAELAVTRPDLVAGLFLVDTPSLPVAVGGRANLESLPFGVGEAFAYTLSGAAPQAERGFLQGCPSWGSCDTAIGDYRNAASVPGTARAIWARRSSPPAFVAASRLEALTVSVTVVSVDQPEEVAEALADRFPNGEAVVADAAGLADLLAGAPASGD